MWSLLSSLDSASTWPLKIFVESIIVGQLWSWLPLQMVFWAGLVNEYHSVSGFADVCSWHLSAEGWPWSQWSEDPWLSGAVGNVSVGRTAWEDAAHAL